MSEMRLLRTEIPLQGRTLRQLKRQARIALYGLYGPGDILYGYEVIVIKIRPAEEAFGREYPERELYPSSAKNSDDWGRIAWSYGRNDLAGAEERYAGLLRTRHWEKSDISDVEQDETRS
jgi:hypothetical protein